MAGSFLSDGQGTWRQGEGSSRSLRLLEVVPEAVLVTDHLGRIMFANLRTEQMFTYPRERLLDRPLQTLVPATAGDGPAWRQVSRPGDDATLGSAHELVGVRRDGTAFPIEVSLFPLDTLGPMVIAVVIRDLSLDHRRAQAAQVTRHLHRQYRQNYRRFGQAFLQVPVAMAMVSARPENHGEILLVNPAFCRLAKRSRTELIGRPVTDLFPPTDPGGARGPGAWLPSPGRDRVAGVEQQVRQAGGRLVWTSVSAALVRDEHGDPDYVFVHEITDITEQRRERRKAQRRSEHDRRIAAVLQAGLVPQVPNRVGSVQVATRYLPAGSGEAVGGDWHDVFALPDGRLALTVGDVAGHGIESAVTMTRLRYCARTLAAAGANPAQVISQLNQIMHTGHPDAAELATVVHAQLDLTRQALTYSNAGHLPLIILAPDGKHGPSPALHAHPLPLLGDPPVGVIADLQYTEHCAHVNAHSVLIGFTDGLIERRHQDIDQALDTLLDSLNRLPPAIAADPEALAANLLTLRANGKRPDDAAVIVLAPLPSLAPRPGSAPHAG